MTRQVYTFDEFLTHNARRRDAQGAFARWALATFDWDTLDYSKRAIKAAIRDAGTDPSDPSDRARYFVPFNALWSEYQAVRREQRRAGGQDMKEAEQRLKRRTDQANLEKSQALYDAVPEETKMRWMIQDLQSALDGAGITNVQRPLQVDGLAIARDALALALNMNGHTGAMGHKSTKAGVVEMLRLAKRQIDEAMSR
jgi:hypothetical protein